MGSALCSDQHADPMEMDQLTIPQEFYPSPPPDMVGQTWSKVRILGQGAFGTVYLARNEYSYFAAVKYMSFTLNTPGLDGRLERLKKEIATMTHLGPHPNVVQLFKSYRTECNVSLAMEYCPMGSLRAYYLHHGALNPFLAKKRLSDILHGLNHLHGQGIIHRDLKCDNIMLANDETAKLGDFGAATVVSGNKSQHTGVGTVYWMAPEVVNMNGHSFQADIWSVGCTLMEMLTATRPHAHTVKNLHQLMDYLNNFPGHRTVVPPSITIPAFQEFLLSCLQIAPESRPSAETLLQKELFSDSLSMGMGAAPCVPDMEDI
eukprot:NODE_2684_length_1120_cov_32.365559_g2562_i0.p1 GENE.NODE_2684_length_1120_cov_32.365559_g2562_i0~~NODE_2684_length_1120_cov_32.365559_g2562_i0.p1  ORF type:complete len:340 (-),score=93.96 NODE_2684_length_1120_cov_32.365559_g2562_i0:100-1053(-)